MNRRLVLVGALAFLIGFTGCGRSNKHPDEMSKAEFEAWLSKTHGLTDLAITEQGLGQFTGTGRKDGKTWQIKVTREARKASWEIKSQDPGGVETKGANRSW